MKKLNWFLAIPQKTKEIFMKNNICDGCGLVFAELFQVGAFKLCTKCENDHRQVMDDLADDNAKDFIEGDL